MRRTDNAPLIRYASKAYEEEETVQRHPYPYGYTSWKQVVAHIVLALGIIGLLVLTR